MDGPLRQKVAAIVRERRDALVQRSMATTIAVPVPEGQAEPTVMPSVSQRDVEQMIDAFIALLVEALETDSREVRTFFLGTVIPGLVSAGAPASSLLGGAVEFAILTSVDVAAELPKEERKPAQLWFARFFNAYLTEMVQVAEEASK